MPKILVKTPFRLVRDDGSDQKFGVGVHEVSEKDADHWYTKIHSEPYVADVDQAALAEIQHIHAELVAAKEALDAEREQLEAEKAELVAAKEVFLKEKADFEKASKKAEK